MITLPAKAFEIRSKENDYIRLEIAEIYGFPDEPSFRGGYDIRCLLTISCGCYRIRTDDYLSSTGALKNFYDALLPCYQNLNGKCRYSVYIPENELEFEIIFDGGDVQLTGSYRDDPASRNVFTFEFFSDQSYFASVLQSLKSLVANLC